MINSIEAGVEKQYCTVWHVKCVMSKSVCDKLFLTCNTCTTSLQAACFLLLVTFSPHKGPRNKSGNISDHPLLLCVKCDLLCIHTPSRLSEREWPPNVHAALSHYIDWPIINLCRFISPTHKWFCSVFKINLKKILKVCKLNLYFISHTRS